MTEDEIKKEIRRLTKRIGEAKGSGAAGELLERLRHRRARLSKELAFRHSSYTLINPEGETEFVGQEEFRRRSSNWLRKRIGLFGDRPNPEAN